MASAVTGSNFTVADAFRIAREAHAKQVDKAGKPYIGHIWRVMGGVEGDAEKMTAALHDYLEDVKGASRQSLLDRGVPEQIADAVEALTKLPDEEGSDEGYFRFVRRAAQNPLARAVKRSDLADNTHPDRVRVFAEQSRVLAEELRRDAEGYRRAAAGADQSLAAELEAVADQFEQKAADVEAKPARLKAKYDTAIGFLEGLG